ncbi:MAG: polyprenol monophosphomannose synthase [Thermoflexales bacterium]|nr:polyprenol monophosphomannose synthase [Thermoflexales bacterium]
MRVTVVLPTYNEAENVPLMLPALLEQPVSVVVVDDNSPDGTGDIAEAWARREPRVAVVRRAGKLGLGTAYVAGFNHALAHGAEAVITIDADFSHNPRYITPMIAAAEHADLVIGSRYVKGGRVGYPFHRRFLSRTANFVARTALGLTPLDCTAGFRLYRAETLRKTPIDRIRSNGYSFLVEMLTYAQRTGIRVAEVPIDFVDRARGVSKISSAEIGKGMGTVGRLFLRRLTGRL